MKDPRFQALAAQLAGYSTALRPGDRVLLELTDIEAVARLLAAFAKDLGEEGGPQW